MQGLDIKMAHLILNLNCILQGIQVNNLEVELRIILPDQTEKPVKVEKSFKTQDVCKVHGDFDQLKLISLNPLLMGLLDDLQMCKFSYYFYFLQAFLEKIGLDKSYAKYFALFEIIGKTFGKQFLCFLCNHDRNMTRHYT